MANPLLTHVTALVFASTCLAQAATITLTTTGSGMLLSGTITYTATLTFLGEHTFPRIDETSRPCDLIGAGCLVGSGLVSFPRIPLPLGSEVTDATLRLFYAPHLAVSPPILLAVIPIDPSQPAVPGSLGLHPGGRRLQVSTEAGTVVTHFFFLEDVDQVAL